jgi:FkbM family methyltransferase
MFGRRAQETTTPETTAEPVGETVDPGFRRRDVADEDVRIYTRKGSRRQVRQLGKEDLGLTLVFDPKPANRQAGRFETAIGGFLGAQHAAWLVKQLDVDLVLDVGANVGDYAKNLRQRGFKGRIVSFEPIPDFIEVLQRESADDPDWHVMGCALGNEHGTAQINWTDDKLSSLLPASDFGKEWKEQLGEAQVRDIEIRRLADVWDEVTAGLDAPRPFLKMDTQGYDVETFKGAGDKVALMHGLQSELSMLPIYEGMPRYLDQLALYESAGFEITGIFPINRDRTTLRAIEFDLMMVGPAGLAERGVEA